MALTITLEVDRSCFRLDSFQQWKKDSNELLARHQINPRNSIAIDAAGRVVIGPSEWRSTAVYPVDVYALEPRVVYRPFEPRIRS